MKNAFTFLSNTTGLAPLAAALAAAVVSAAYAQDITAVSDLGASRTDLAPHVAMVSFVPSNASSAEEAVQSGAISAAEGHAITAVAARTLPIPVFGPLITGAVVGKLIKTFHPDKPTTGFNVAFLPGLSASTIVQRGEASFVIPAQSIQGGNPALVRVRISNKDSARIVRSVHAYVKVKNGAINPLARDTKILGVDENVIPCSREIRGGELVLTPNSALESGEYAVIVLPTQQDAVPVAGNWLWDFRVM